MDVENVADVSEIHTPIFGVEVCKVKEFAYIDVFVSKETTTNEKENNRNSRIINPSNLKMDSVSNSETSETLPTSHVNTENLN
jgi:hypothetical protein